MKMNEFSFRVCMNEHKYANINGTQTYIYVWINDCFPSTVPVTQKRYLYNSPGRKTITMNQEKRKGSEKSFPPLCYYNHEISSRFYIQCTFLPVQYNEYHNSIKFLFTSN